MSSQISFLNYLSESPVLLASNHKPKERIQVQGGGVLVDGAARLNSSISQGVGRVFETTVSGGGKAIEHRQASKYLSSDYFIISLNLETGVYVCDKSEARTVELTPNHQEYQYALVGLLEHLKTQEFLTENKEQKAFLNSVCQKIEKEIDLERDGQRIEYKIVAPLGADKVSVVIERTLVNTRVTYDLDFGTGVLAVSGSNGEVDRFASEDPEYFMKVYDMWNMMTCELCAVNCRPTAGNLSAAQKVRDIFRLEDAFLETPPYETRVFLGGKKLEVTKRNDMTGHFRTYSLNLETGSMAYWFANAKAAANWRPKDGISSLLEERNYREGVREIIGFVRKQEAATADIQDKIFLRKVLVNIYALTGIKSEKVKNW